MKFYAIALEMHRSRTTMLQMVWTLSTQDFAAVRVFVWVGVCVRVSGWKILVRTTILKHYIHVYIAMDTHSFGRSWIGLIWFGLDWFLCNSLHFNGTTGIFSALLLLFFRRVYFVFILYVYLGSEICLTIKLIKVLLAISFNLFDFCFFTYYITCCDFGCCCCCCYSERHKREDGVAAQPNLAYSGG